MYNELDSYTHNKKKNKLLKLINFKSLGRTHISCSDNQLEVYSNEDSSGRNKVNANS